MAFASATRGISVHSYDNLCFVVGEMRAIFIRFDLFVD